MYCFFNQAVPSDVVSTPSLRTAMGITSEPTQSSSTAAGYTVDASAKASWPSSSVQSDSASKQSELDEDLNEFFGQGASTNVALGPVGVGMDA
jgi:hypothetical protein